jgi:hypothetical protein
MAALLAVLKMGPPAQSLPAEQRPASHLRKNRALVQLPVAAVGSLGAQKAAVGQEDATAQELEALYRSVLETKTNGFAVAQRRPKCRPNATKTPASGDGQGSSAEAILELTIDARKCASKQLSLAF